MERAAGAVASTPDLSAAALPAVLAAAQEVFAHPVAPEDNFFDLGGNSLAAFRMVAAVAVAGYRLPVEDIFDQPDLRALAARAVPDGTP